MKKATGRWLWNLEPLFFTLSLANFRAGPPSIPLRRQEEPSLLSFGPAPGWLPCVGMYTQTGSPCQA